MLGCRIDDSGKHARCITYSPALLRLQTEFNTNAQKVKDAKGPVANALMARQTAILQKMEVLVDAQKQKPQVAAAKKPKTKKADGPCTKYGGDEKACREAPEGCKSVTWKGVRYCRVDVAGAGQRSSAVSKCHGYPNNPTRAQVHDYYRSFYTQAHGLHSSSSITALCDYMSDPTHLTDDYKADYSNAKKQFPGLVATLAPAPLIEHYYVQKRQAPRSKASSPRSKTSSKTSSPRSKASSKTSSKTSSPRSHPPSPLKSLRT